MTTVARPRRRVGCPDGASHADAAVGARAGGWAPKEKRSAGAERRTDYFIKSQRSGLNRRPLDYESSALPLSYGGDLSCDAARENALERTRTAMPFGTTPSRWRVYQFHHQGKTTS